ncbi:MAG: hypothetical protein JWO46_2498 [Nocardioidaceae bacterium]|nr:hypothetical protein [Nocardioidaceae bacterium]
MSTRNRIVVFAVVVTVAVIGAVGYAVHDRTRYQKRIAEAPKVASTAADAYDKAPRIVFRNTAIGTSYGLVATVPLADPSAPRALTTVACDRVDASEKGASCLRTERGVVTGYSWLDLSPSWATEHTEPLAGIPSRTRLSADGTLVASTSFVTGHSYMQIGFSTATVVRKVGGSSYGNLERFQLILDGKKVNPTDRNVWGVTFAADDNTFYATVATGGTPYLVKGDLAKRTLTTLRSPAECPSLSPDGTHVAYKVNQGSGSTTHWTIGVLDLATGTQVLLTGEKASVDDQVEWLDDQTLLYGLPRADEAGVTDVWAIGTDAAATPRLFLKQAWSPSVVR